MNYRTKTGAEVMKRKPKIKTSRGETLSEHPRKRIRKKKDCPNCRRESKVVNDQYCIVCGFRWADIK